jgi:uncharacterized protein (TIGR02996 family)
MATEREAFLDAILENPQDRSRRVAFADWLEGQGDPNEELIRLELEIDRANQLPCHCYWCCPRLQAGYAVMHFCNRKHHCNKLWPRHRALVAQGAVPLKKMLAERKAALAGPSTPAPTPPGQSPPAPDGNRVPPVGDVWRIVCRHRERPIRQDSIPQNEADWLASTDPTSMLEYLRRKVSDRQLRLFACACCWSLRLFLQDERRRRPIEVAERFADGLATVAEMEAVAYPVPVAVSWVSERDAFLAAVRAAHAAAFALACQPPGPLDPSAASQMQPSLAFALVAQYAGSRRRMMWEFERAAQTNLLRCIVGNPFRLVAVDPAWLGWNQGTVPKLALGIYHDGAFECLPILADALEDAGCGDPQILEHCRRPGPHVRGCWVVDLLLSKDC